MADKTKNYVFDEAQALLDKKTKDYQGSSVKRSDYLDLSWISLYVHMHDKVIRIKSVMLNKNKTQFESARDSALDLINYAQTFIKFIDGKVNEDDNKTDG
jgi:hypothetical protein